MDRASVGGEASDIVDRLLGGDDEDARQRDYLFYPTAKRPRRRHGLARRLDEGHRRGRPTASFHSGVDFAAPAGMRVQLRRQHRSQQQSTPAPQQGLFFVRSGCPGTAISRVIKCPQEISVYE